jgi:hypothetical protein
MSMTALDVLLDDFGCQPPRGTARRLAHGCPRVTDDAWLSALLGTSPGYWLRLAGACRDDARPLTLDGLTARYAWHDDDGLWVGVVEGVPDRISFHAREEADMPEAFRQAVRHWRETAP